MTATTAPAPVHRPAPAAGLGSVLRSEWTKFRTVRGWTITAVSAGLLIVLFAYLGTFRHETGTCTGVSASSATCRTLPAQTLPVGPTGIAVTDTYYFVHRTLAGNGSITARVGPLRGLAQGGRNPNAVSIGDLNGVSGGVQPWAKAGLILTASTRPGAAYAAVMLTGAHGVRMQSNYTGDIAGRAVSSAQPQWLRLTRSGQTVTGSESANGIVWTKVGSVRLAALPQDTESGLFVTSPPTAPTAQALVPGGTSSATGATASFGTPSLQGAWASGPWATQNVNHTNAALLPTLTSVGAHQSGSGFTITGSGDIAPSLGAGETDRDALTGVFVGLIALIVLGAIFITAEYRRGLILTTLSASPRRGQVLIAKALVIGAVAFVVAAAAAAISLPLGNHILESNGNAVYPMSTLTELRVILGTGAMVALAAVLALALGTAFRRGAGAVTATIVLIVLPYVLAFAAAVPAGVAQWLMRITPAAGFAVQQTLPRYHQVSFLYTPSEGFYPLAPGLGLAVLAAYTLVALLVAGRLLRTRDA